MFLRIGSIAFMAFIASCSGDDLWTGLTVRWSLNASEAFYVMPKTLHDAEIDGWTKISGAVDSHRVVALGYYGDPTFMLIFSKASGSVIGYQMAIPVNEIDPKQPLQWAKLDTVITKTLNGKDSYYTITIYFHQDKSTDVRRLWFQKKKGLWEIPTKVDQLLAETDYLKKNCIRNMATHYYTWNSTTDCTNMNPLAILGQGNDVFGVLLRSFGTLSTRGIRRWWDLFTNGTSILSAISDPPACALQAIDDFGSDVSLHVWFIDGSPNITCSE